MLIETLQLLFRRDLEKLKIELISYKNEEIIWEIDKKIANSAGNLCLHLVGNLNTYIGAELGKTGYVRNRPLEFSAKNILRETLLQMIDETILVVENALNQLSTEQLSAIYPILVFDKETSTEYLLVHLTTHLSYHLGQISYHRRLLDH